MRISHELPMTDNHTDILHTVSDYVCTIAINRLQFKPEESFQRILIPRPCRPGDRIVCGWQ